MAPTIEKISAVTFRVVNMTEFVRFYRDVLGMELLYNGEGTGFSSLFSPVIPARNNRSLDWFVIGEKENRERTRAENPPPQNAIVRN
jgi:catechol 2,3-dioxygenase-like lactoylglutathione lyase family enzyme